MKIYVPNYYQAGGSIDRGIPVTELPVYDDQGSIAIASSGASGSVNWIQSSFVPTAGTSRRLWNVEMAMDLTVQDVNAPIIVTITLPYPVPIIPDVPLVGYFTTSSQATSLNAKDYWDVANGANDSLVLSFHPRNDVIGNGLELLYLNITVATYVQ